MNFLEALKSGKPFKRVDDLRDCEEFLDGQHINTRHLGGMINTRSINSREWFLSDFEVEEPKVTVTRSKILEALRDCATQEGLSRTLVHSPTGRTLVHSPTGPCSIPMLNAINWEPFFKRLGL